MNKDVEQRLKELEAEVLADRAAGLPARVEPAVPPVRARQAKKEPEMEPLVTTKERKRGRLSLPRSLWGKIVVFGGLVAAGIFGIWLFKQLLAIALWVGGTLAIAAILYYFIFYKKKDK